MSIYDEYQIVINEAQRRLIMRALTNAVANDRRSTGGGALTRPTDDEWMQLCSGICWAAFAIDASLRRRSAKHISFSTVVTLFV